MRLHSISNDPETVDTTDVCAGYDDEAHLKVSQAFGGENEIIFQMLEIGRLETFIGP